MASLSRFVRPSILTALTALAALGLSAVTSSAGQAKPRKTTHSAKALAIAKNDRAAIAKLPASTRKVLARGPLALRDGPRTRFASTTGGARVPVRRTGPGGKQSNLGGLPSSMDITAWSPEHGGTPGGTLELLGYGLPVNGLSVYIGGTKLAQVSSTASKVVVTLPSSSTTGPLKVKRKSDGAWATLESSYAVATTPPPPVFSHFDADASGHHAVNAYLLALMSWYAYDDVVGAAGDSAAWEDAVETLLDAQGLPQVDCFDHTNLALSTQGCVAANDDIVVVFLRGTQTNYQDWGTDLTAVPIPVLLWGPGVTIHLGFSAALDATWPDILSKVTAMRNKGQKVWLTGHSLGGALATLAAMRLEQETSMPVHGVYTYGAPAVGNESFASAYEAHGINHQRYTNARDIVPALPPSVAIATGYAHVGNLVEISTGGSIDPSSTNEPVLTADKHFDPFHSEYPDDLRAAITPQSLQGQMPAVP